ARFVCRNQVDMEAEALGHRRRTLQLLPARLRRCKPKTAGANPTCSLAGLAFELAVKLGRIAHQSCEIAAAAQLAYQSRRVPCRAMRELQALEQHNVALAAFCEVVRDAAADDAAADDDDAGGARNSNAKRRRCISAARLVDCFARTY